MRFVLATVFLLFSSVAYSQVETTTETTAPKQVKTDKFRVEVVKAIRKARKAGAITQRQSLKLRVAMISPAFRARAEDLAVTQMAFYDGNDAPDLPRNTSDGKIQRAAIDWDGFAAFLERLVPILLQLLEAFAHLETLNFAGGVA